MSVPIQKFLTVIASRSREALSPSHPWSAYSTRLSYKVKSGPATTDLRFEIFDYAFSILVWIEIRATGRQTTTELSIPSFGPSSVQQQVCRFGIRDSEAAFSILVRIQLRATPVLTEDERTVCESGRRSAQVMDLGAFSRLWGLSAGVPPP